MKKLTLVLGLLFSVIPISAQSYKQGSVLKWDVEAYGKHGNVTRNAAVYYIQIEKTIYQVTRGTTKPETNLIVGRQVQCRIETDHLFVPNEKGKEVKFSVIGASPAL